MGTIEDSLQEHRVARVFEGTSETSSIISVLQRELNAPGGIVRVICAFVHLARLIGKEDIPTAFLRERKRILNTIRDQVANYMKSEDANETSLEDAEEIFVALNVLDLESSGEQEGVSAIAEGIQNMNL